MLIQYFDTVSFLREHRAALIEEIRRLDHLLYLAETSIRNGVLMRVNIPHWRTQIEAINQAIVGFDNALMKLGVTFK